MKAKMKRFLKHYKEGMGIIKYACEKAGVSRRTYYNWIKSDKEFKEACEDEGEGMVDLVESKLLTNINNGDTTAIIFYLKTKGKHRGYVETVENNVTVNKFEELIKSLPDE